MQGAVQALVFFGNQNTNLLLQARLLINIQKARDKEFNVRKRPPGVAGFRCLSCLVILYSS